MIRWLLLSAILLAPPAIAGEEAARGCCPDVLTSTTAQVLAASRGTCDHEPGSPCNMAHCMVCASMTNPGPDGLAFGLTKSNRSRSGGDLLIDRAPTAPPAPPPRHA